MKKLIIIFSFLIITSLNAQVIISPYIVYTDAGNRYGSMIVQNESTEIYEISISFVFGYPISDSVGTVSMKYINEPSPELPSIVDWIRAFPKKFVLNPKQRQIVRMSVRPPAGIKDGTYWARIVTSAVPQSTSIDTVNKGVTAKIKFVLNQVTSIFYRTNNVETGIKINDVKVLKDTNKITLRTSVERTNNSPFIGDVAYTLTDSLGNVVKEGKEYVAVYFDLIKNLTFEFDKEIEPGRYKAEIKFISNEKEDIPESKLKPLPPITKTIELEVN